MAKRDRIGKPKPGSIRYEARERGVTEARIRKERAAARGYSGTQGRGHRGKGETSLYLQENVGRFDRMRAKGREKFLKAVEKEAAEGKMSMHELWTLLVSPDKAKRK